MTMRQVFFLSLSLPFPFFFPSFLLSLLPSTSFLPPLIPFLIYFLDSTLKVSMQYAREHTFIWSETLGSKPDTLLSEILSKPQLSHLQNSCRTWTYM